ncbi:MAG: hypothetical protein NWF00_01610 [Candidatus Bathyarchaeota archaeon]|nr:hypothetical protein [Candidatus Bathyarchaeota archaeon]
MSEFYQLVKRLHETLSRSGLDYAFTGALAVSFYGSPRTTSDVDVMVAIGDAVEVKARVVEALRCAGVDAEEQKIDNVLRSGYNIASFKDTTTPFRVDVIFSSKKLERQAGKIGGLDTFFQKPEGLVLAKLRMIKATVPRERAAKDEHDVKAILTFTKVDLDTVKRQAKKDKTLKILEKLALKRH